jgi:hypothetical protein
MATLKITVIDAASKLPIQKARIIIEPAIEYKELPTTDVNGDFTIDLHPGKYTIHAEAFGTQSSKKSFTLKSDSVESKLTVGVLALPILQLYDDQNKPIAFAPEGKIVRAELITSVPSGLSYKWIPGAGKITSLDDQPSVSWDTTGVNGPTNLDVNLKDDQGALLTYCHLVPIQPMPASQSSAPATPTPPAPVNPPQPPTSTTPPPDTGGGGQQPPQSPITPPGATGAQPSQPPISVQLVPSSRGGPTDDQAFWMAIRNRTRAISYQGSAYSTFIDLVLGQNKPVRDSGYEAVLNDQRQVMGSRILGLGAYELLRTATQVFLILESGVADWNEFDRYDSSTLYDPNQEFNRTGQSLSFSQADSILTRYLGNPPQLPYIRSVLPAYLSTNSNSNPFAPGSLLASRVESPSLIELIWSYWHEEGMLVQTLNAISLRFQNRRSETGRDPLAHLEIGPLYPLNNLLWGYVQGEQNRLTVARRNYEYNHQYGLSLVSRAADSFRPVENRSRFLEAFHALLSLTIRFYRQADDTTVVPDAFPLLNAIREVHLILAEGAHNQFGDLPWTARGEMLMQQWLLSRPEMRTFLQSRAMVPYREPWMAQVDTMKSLQGWTDISVTHFHNLAVFGEQLLLSIRYGNWMGIDDPISVANWARYWRAEVQGYIHAYRAATGVDLSVEARDSEEKALWMMQPTELIHRRGRVQTSAVNVSAASTDNSFRSRRANRL